MSAGKKLGVLSLLIVLLSASILFRPDPVLSQTASPPRSTEAEIQADAVPARDLQDLVIRLKGVSPDAAYAVVPSPEGGRKVGDHSDFFIADEANNRYFTVGATLKVVTPHAYMYLADGLDADQTKIDEAARFFDEHVYAGDRGYFGPEPEVGLDGDPHVSVVNATIPGLGGYYTSVDGYPRAVHPYSNERKAIYMNVQAAPMASTQYYGILAHEFEHMIQWNTSKDEESWVKEGSAEVATDANKLRTSDSFVQSFQSRADTQLNSWASTMSERIPHYGGAYLFISYVLEQFGGFGSAAQLLTGTTKGADSFDRFLASRGSSSKFEDLFNDWVVANYLDGAGTSDPRYRYDGIKVQVPSTEKVTKTTGWQDRTVHQFAADYIDLSGSWSSAKIHFQGSTATRVIAPPAHSGNSFWWSNRGDLEDSRMTHIFDLRKLSSATLRFWAWYDLEDGYDYAYVMASRDGGATWTTLPVAGTTADNKSGNNLGNGFTGKSGSPEPRWTQRSVDLTPYCGDVVLLRFETVTDDAVNGPGFAVDDISIPELGYAADGESDAGWLESGFVRTNGDLQQRFSLQIIKIGDQTTVEPVPVSDGAAEVEIDNKDGKLRNVVLVVSGLTRYTTELAHYRYSVDTTP
ncbi:MAG TPA: hypothetical protein VF960_14460 [Chloroflexota bacterium]